MLIAIVYCRSSALAIFNISGEQTRTWIYSLCVLDSWG